MVREGDGGGQSESTRLFLQEAVRQRLADRQKRIELMVRLCGMPMAFNEAEMLLNLADGAIAVLQHKADAVENMRRLNSGSAD